MNNVISLVPPKLSQPDPDLIADLERLLKEAKSGDLEGLAWAAVYSGYFLVDWDGTSSCLTLNGAIGMLAHDFAEAINQIPFEEETAS